MSSAWFAARWTGSVAVRDIAGTCAKAAPLPFEEAPVTKLPFFKFLHVDSVVAVAQGRSGSVAVWTRSE